MFACANVTKYEINEICELQNLHHNTQYYTYILSIFLKLAYRPCASVLLNTYLTKYVISILIHYLRKSDNNIQIMNVYECNVACEQALFELSLKFEREPAGLANKNASVRCLERRRVPIG